MKNFGKKGAWAYPGTAQFFRVPPIISGMGKLPISNFACTFMGSIGTKAHYKFGKGSRGRCHGLLKIFRAPIHRAHRAVIFAIAQLSCLLLFFIVFNAVPVCMQNIFLLLRQVFLFPAMYRIYQQILWK